MSELSRLHDNLEKYKSHVNKKQFLTCFDGFIDQMINVVDKRKGLESYDPVRSMTRFSRLIGEASNRSSLREVVIESVDIGGCAVNMGDGLAALGGSLDFYGSTGNPMHKAFEPFADKCRHFVPLSCDPGLTMAFEFEDGKYMLSSVSQLADLNRELLKGEFEDGRFHRSAKEADLIAFTDWTLYPHMTDCWAYVQETVLSSLEHRPYIFIDLVDPRSRSKEDIKEMLDVLKNFELYGKTIFGGNLNEGNVLAELLGLEPAKGEGEDVARLASDIRGALGVSMAAIHCIGGAACADDSGQHWAEGPYCPTPLKSTGAGDRFNAGFALATVLELEPKERLLFAGATSGFFVRNGFSGSLEQVMELINLWDRGEL